MSRANIFVVGMDEADLEALREVPDSQDAQGFEVEEPAARAAS